MRSRPTLSLVVMLLVAALVPDGRSQDWSPWHALGPFEHRDGFEDLSEQHAPEREFLEMKLDRPGPNLEKMHRGEEGEELRWRPMAGGNTALDVGPIDFTKVLSPVPGKADWADLSAAYLHRSVRSRSDRGLRVHMGSDDSLCVWLNGERVLQREVGRGLNVYDEMLVLPLRRGLNHLLVKVVNGVGGWGFQMGPPRRVNQAGVAGAIDKGVQHFLDTQLIDGSWGTLRHLAPGHSSFTIYTLLKCGVPREHPVIRRGREFLLAHQNDAVYATASKVMALAEMNEEGDKKRIETLLKVLRQSSTDNGLYLYSRDGYHADLERDLSNTLFAALALRAAAKAGVEVSTTAWEKLVRGTMKTWQGSGGKARTGVGVEPRGFRYRTYGNPSSSMTVAGISILAIAQEQAGGRVAGSLRGTIQRGIRGGLSWLEHHFQWTTNAGHPSGHHNYFSLYGLERVGALLDTPILARRDWYFEGSDQLLKWQQKNGTWAEKAGHVETQLSLLFLARATAGVTGQADARARALWTTEGEPDAAVALRGSGDSPVTLWMDGVHADRRAELEWKGEEGRGPRIAWVEYFARRDIPDAVEQSIGRAEGDAERPAGTERFGVQHQFPRNGTWFVHARVACVREPTAPEGAGEVVELVSATMTLTIREAIAADQVAVTSSGTRNLLRGVAVHAEASSQIEGEEAHRAVDGDYGTRWHCQVSDGAPWLRITPARALRGRRLVLSHGWPRPTYEKTQRPLTGVVILNGRERFEWRMDPDPMTKTVIEFSRLKQIKTLELRIEETMFAALGDGAFGFSEVELLK